MFEVVKNAIEIMAFRLSATDQTSYADFANSLNIKYFQS